MEKVCIYFLLILLVCQQTNCFRECERDQTLVDGKCQDCEKPNMISSDKQSCDSECKKSEYIEDMDYYFLCVKKCSVSTINPTGKNCPLCDQDIMLLVQKQNTNTCQEQCDVNQSVDDDLQCILNSECKGFIDQYFEQCDESCDRFILGDGEESFQECQENCDKYQSKIGEQKFCWNKCPQNTITNNISDECYYNKSECQNVISLDEKECVEECENGQLILILPDYQICSNQPCSEFEYEENYLKFCSSKCPENQITDTKNNKCYQDPEDCEGDISSDNKHCLERCQWNQKIQYPEKNNIRVCLSECNNGYSFKKNNNTYCANECPNNMITVIPLKTCTTDRQDCKGYLMSVDERSCDSICNSPDILKQEKCVPETECSGGHEIIDETTDQIECKNKRDRSYSCYLESSDGRRCLKYCNPHEMLFITKQNDVIVRMCKGTISANEIKETKDNIINQLKNVETISEFQQIKKDFTLFISSYLTNDPQTLPELLQFSKEIAREFFSTLLIENLKLEKYNVHSVGSNNTVLVCFQLIDNGKSITNSFNIESILNQNPVDLTEINSENTSSDENGILLFIINNNPQNREANSKDFPLVLADIVNLRPKRNLAVREQHMQAIFSKKEAFKQYLCLHYDETLSQFIRDTRPSIDKNTITCLLDGPTSVEILEDCEQLIGSSACSDSTDFSSRISGILSVLIQIIICVVVA